MAVHTASTTPRLEAGRYEVERHDEVYAEPGGLALEVRVYQPKGAPPGRPGIVDVHGGAWRYFDRKVDASQCRGLASAGAVVAAIDFRQAPGHRWPTAVADVAAGVRWLKSNADRFGVDPDAVLLLGGSSGGHLVQWVALRPEGSECRATAIAGEARDVGAVDAHVRGVLALWPVAAPDQRFRYLRERRDAGDTESTDPLFHVDALIESQELFFGDEEMMREASIVELLANGDHEQLPPLFLAHPELDENVPRAMSVDVVERWRAAGGQAELRDYPGLTHGFVNFGGEAAAACIDDLIEASNAFLLPAEQE